MDTIGRYRVEPSAPGLDPVHFGTREIAIEHAVKTSKTFWCVFKVIDTRHDGKNQRFEAGYAYQGVFHWAPSIKKEYT